MFGTRCDISSTAKWSAFTKSAPAYGIAAACRERQCLKALGTPFKTRLHRRRVTSPVSHTWSPLRRSIWWPGGEFNVCSVLFAGFAPTEPNWSRLCAVGKNCVRRKLGIPSVPPASGRARACTVIRLVRIVVVRSVALCPWLHNANGLKNAPR